MAVSVSKKPAGGCYGAADAGFVCQALQSVVVCLLWKNEQLPGWGEMGAVLNANSISAKGEFTLFRRAN